MELTNHRGKHLVIGKVPGSAQYLNDVTVVAALHPGRDAVDHGSHQLHWGLVIGQ